MPHEAGQPAYPPTLQALVRGVTNGKEGAQPLYFLRRLWLQRSGSDLQLTLLETNDPDEATSPGVQPGVERSSRNGLSSDMYGNTVVGWKP
ncbi:hypothetical protein [Sphaerotilus sp.]|uniref:hypothetical protein n=1 Tax=Sphaerotilus sp. TaxID=2093942 RepID=UPI0025D246D0|nr:hypothetical protein [Sphaerotilus sp.]